MRQLATRVISGECFQSASVDGRKSEAQAIYNRMMAIKSTNHPYEIQETDEPATQTPPEPTRATNPILPPEEQEKRFTSALAKGIAEGVVTALEQQETTKSKKARVAL
jgi:hypothetical protein